jgi:hypothetical protein
LIAKFWTKQREILFTAKGREQYLFEKHDKRSVQGRLAKLSELKVSKLVLTILAQQQINLLHCPKS